jgi:DNA end-binding protein Ku
VEIMMPRASWKGFLRLSLVSCPIYLSPATTRTKSIRLNRVWVPRDDRREQEWDSDEEPPRRPRGREEEMPSQPRSSGAPIDAASLDEPEYIGPATRIALRPHDPHTGEEVERDEVVKGYEYERGRFVTFTPDELKALDVESSKIIDLTNFVQRAELDPVYFSTPYYVYPDGPIAAEALRVIGVAMAEADVVAIGRVTLSRRERMVMVEPRGAGFVLVTLRAAEEIRAAEFGPADGEVDPDMVAIVETIIKRRIGAFDPATFKDRYREALRELIEAKLKGLPVKTNPVAAPPPVLDLMAALKRSLAQETGGSQAKTKRKPAPDLRQPNLLLPLSGKGRRGVEARAAETAPKRQKKA